MGAPGVLLITWADKQKGEKQEEKKSLHVFLIRNAYFAKIFNIGDVHVDDRWIYRGKYHVQII